MRRREFLAGGAAAFAAGVAVAEAPTWTLTAADDRYVVRLLGAALICDCHPPAGDQEPLAVPDEAAMIVAGRQPVAWRVATSHQPNPHTLRIALAALDYPLVADIVHAIDPGTGLLSRTTLVRHLGVGPAIDIAETLGFWLRIAEPVDRMLYLAGDWAHETQLRRGQGDVPLELESRTGKTGFAFQPYVALRAGETTWLCQIFPGRATGPCGLIRPAPRRRAVRRAQQLALPAPACPGAGLTLPSVLFGRFEGGLNVATRHLQDRRRARRARRIPIG